jgi:hypothetical protein
MKKYELSDAELAHMDELHKQIADMVDAVPSGMACVVLLGVAASIMRSAGSSDAEIIAHTSATLSDILDHWNNDCDDRKPN